MICVSTVYLPHSWSACVTLAVTQSIASLIIQQYLSCKVGLRYCKRVSKGACIFLFLNGCIFLMFLSQAWDDVVRKEKPKEDPFEFKKRLTLDHEKSKLSLAEIYEQEYLKLNQVDFEGTYIAML